MANGFMVSVDYYTSHEITKLTGFGVSHKHDVTFLELNTTQFVHVPWRA